MPYVERLRENRWRLITHSGVISQARSALAGMHVVATGALSFEIVSNVHLCILQGAGYGTG